jgi:hypothetical protein
VLFRKKIEPSCAYCSHGRSGAEEDVLCIFRGVMSPWDKCRRFNYDPLRRIPEAEPLPVTEADDASFEL